MTSTLPQATSPDLTNLIQTAHNLGIRVWWRNLHTTSYYSHKHRSIWLSNQLTNREARSLLAHELAHAIWGDDGPQPPHIEARAWRYAAQLLISETEYRLAEKLHGSNPSALAEALDVTPEIIHAYQESLRRTP